LGSRTPTTGRVQKPPDATTSQFSQDHSTMKQRITFIQPEGTGIDPSGVHVNPDTLVFSNARNAALEKRLTLGLEDLPAEVGIIAGYSRKTTTNKSSGHCDLGTMPRNPYPLVCTRRPRHPSPIRLPPPRRSARLLHAAHSRRRSKPLPTHPEALRPRAKMQFYYRVLHPALADL
jgi:hypothetical protein